MFVDIVEAFEVGNFDHFMRLENKLLGRISDKRKREEVRRGGGRWWRRRA